MVQRLSEYLFCYWVKNQEGKEAFLKAIDLTNALRSEDPMQELHKISTAFLFESELYEHCADASRIINMEFPRDFVPVVS